jgi:hypothetical protein
MTTGSTPRREAAYFSASVAGRNSLLMASPKYYRLRFRDPLLQPYVIMRGLRNGRITDTDLRRFRPA